MRLLAFGHTLMPRVPRGVGGRGLGVEDIISFWPYPNFQGFQTHFVFKCVFMASQRRTN
jgi:hypothetical protein